MLPPTSLLFTLLVTFALLDNLTCLTAASHSQERQLSKRSDQSKGRSRSASARQGQSHCSGSDFGVDFGGTCYDLNTPCAVNRKTGKCSCAEPADCPPVTGYDLVCDSTKDLCCCQMSQQDVDSNRLFCNDVYNDEQDAVWKKACTIPELNSSVVCSQAWTQGSTCMKYDASGQGKLEICSDPSKTYCGVERQTGNVAGCVPRTDCPSDEKEKITCDSDSRYCCCYNPPQYGFPQCNDILHKTDDSVWKDFCKHADVKGLAVCQKSPVPVPQQCLAYCNANARLGAQGRIEAHCGTKDTSKSGPHCPSPCPQGCDKYCQDGMNMECPELSSVNSNSTTGPEVTPATPEGPAVSAAEAKKTDVLGVGTLIAILVGVLVAA